MTPAQRVEVVQHLSGPVRIREAAAMIGIAYREFERDWSKGHGDSQAGLDTPEARWFLDCSAARGRCIATLRSEAHAAAGSRESADLLRLVEHLTSEPEPLAEKDDDVRSRSALLSVSDKLNDPRLSADDRARLQDAQEDAQRAMHRLLNELVSPGRDVRVGGGGPAIDRRSADG